LQSRARRTPLEMTGVITELPDFYTSRLDGFSG